MCSPLHQGQEQGLGQGKGWENGKEERNRMSEWICKTGTKLECIVSLPLGHKRVLGRFFFFLGIKIYLTILMTMTRKTKERWQRRERERKRERKWWQSFKLRNPTMRNIVILIKVFKDNNSEKQNRRRRRRLLCSTNIRVLCRQDQIFSRQDQTIFDHWPSTEYCDYHQRNPWEIMIIGVQRTKKKYIHI